MWQEESDIVPENFADTLAAWIDPAVLTDSAKAYAVDRNCAIEPRSLVVTSPTLTHALEGGFAELVVEFLKAFRIPPGLMSVVRAMNTERTISEKAWKWIAGLRFEGQVYPQAHGHGNPELHLQAVLIINERDAVADIIHGPLTALLDMVSFTVERWRSIGNVSASPIFHRHSSPSPLFVFVEAHVFNALGYESEPLTDPPQKPDIGMCGCPLA